MKLNPMWEDYQVWEQEMRFSNLFHNGRKQNTCLFAETNKVFAF